MTIHVCLMKPGMAHGGQDGGVRQGNYDSFQFPHPINSTKTDSDPLHST